MTYRAVDCHNMMGGRGIRVEELKIWTFVFGFLDILIIIYTTYTLQIIYYHVVESVDEPPCPMQTYIEKTKKVMSWEECSSNCRKRPDCKYWTWFDGKNGGKSYLCIAVTISRSVRKKSSTWSGTRECGGEILIIGLCHLISEAVLNI